MDDWPNAPAYFVAWVNCPDEPCRHKEHRPKSCCRRPSTDEDSEKQRANREAFGVRAIRHIPSGKRKSAA